MRLFPNKNCAKHLRRSQIAAIAFTPPLNGQLVGKNVWRVRMAAFDTAGSIVPLLDVTTDEGFVFNDKARVYQHRWTPPSETKRQQLLTYGTEKACIQHGTSIWFEDLTGHVAPPGEIRWIKPPELRAAQGDNMQPGEILNPNQSITSANGRYTFIYQGDGNLVLYDGGSRAELEILVS